MMPLIDGRPAECLSVRDRGLQYADGLFETVRFFGEHAPLWGRHMARLHAGCLRLGIAPPDAETLIGEAREVVGEHASAIVKIIVTRGSGARGYRPDDIASPARIVSAFPVPEVPTAWRSEGIRVRCCAMRLARQPALAGLKTLARLEQVLARMEWRDPDLAEGLMCDTEGCLIGATQANVFWLEGATLFTPGLSRCGIAGVMRATVLDLARSSGHTCLEVEAPMTRLERADEVFLTNAVHGILPVREIEGRRYMPGQATARLISGLAAGGFAP